MAGLTTTASSSLPSRARCSGLAAGRITCTSDWPGCWVEDVWDARPAVEPVPGPTGAICL